MKLLESADVEVDDVLEDLIESSEDNLMKKIIELLCVPELHLLLGVVEKLLGEFEKTEFSTEEEGVKFMNEFLKKVFIVRKSYQGGRSLEGNQSRMFLKCVHNLELELMNYGD